MKRRVGGLAFAILTVAIVGVIVTAAYRIVRLDPDVTLEHLRGRTPDEVIAEFGQPTFGDPRQSSWNEATDGPLRFYYNGPVFQRYGIVFEHGRVVQVVRTRK